ncbi:MAG TPA: hypothetical protein VFZ53_22345 [Polyangiaceae bacterium]
MARVPVPTKPKLDDEDYTLGGSGWMDEFGRTTEGTRQDAAALNLQGGALRQQATAAQNRATPETNFGRSQAFGGAQTGAADWMRDFAQGPQGPSAAQAQLQQGANQSMKQSLALARTGSGFGESANGMAQAQRANADTMANASNQAATLRAQEDQAFRAQQLQAMGGAADIYGQTAGREGDQAQFATQAELQAQQARDAMQLGLSDQSIQAQTAGVQGQLGATGQNLDAQNAALQGRVAQGQTAADLYGTEAQVFKERLRRDEALAEQRRANRGEAAGMVGQAAAAAASIFSDERTKQGVKRASLRSRYEALGD